MKVDERQCGFACLKVAEFRVNGHLCQILLKLSFVGSFDTSVPSGIEFQVLVDGIKDDDMFFVMDWNHLLHPVDGAEEFLNKE